MSVSLSAGSGVSNDAGGLDVASSDEATLARLEQLRGAQQNLAQAFADLHVGHNAVAAIEEARAQAAEIVEAAHQQAQAILSAAKFRAHGLFAQAAATIAQVDDPEAFEQELARLREMMA